MLAPDILKTDPGGRPVDWISYQSAVCHIISGDVLWSYGDLAATIKGGVSALTGERSVVEVPSILAVTGSYHRCTDGIAPALTNENLFRRDRFICAYCGESFAGQRKLLSRDHVHPRSKGGEDRWENVLTSCKDCNSRKSDKLTFESGMQPLFVPYRPSYVEGMILRGRRILADQMDYLVSQIPKGLRQKYLSA